MQWIDGHLDLAYLAVNGRDLRIRCADPQAGCVSLPDLREGGITTVFATICVLCVDEEPAKPATYRRGDSMAAHRAGIEQLDVYRRLEDDGLITMVRTAADLDRSTDALKVVLLMEGADPIRSPEDVTWWHSKGLRAVGLTWATGTRYAGGNAVPGPLTPDGQELVWAMDEVGMIHDVSHLCDVALDELLATASGPVIATHSNSRTVMGEDNQRHLRDSHIKAIAGRGGIIGLNLCGQFLAKDRRADVADCVTHLKHISGIVGHRRGVALGSDLDGGFPPIHLPEGLDHPRKLEALLGALADAGWSPDDLRSFAWGNWTQFLQETLPDA